MLSLLPRAARIFVVDPVRDLWRPGLRQIGALDFLRTAAVLMVVLFHLREAYLACGGEPSWLTRLPPLKYGVVGVDLFFVLSGYLIGGQLWRELAASGTIRIDRFLLRRGLRIWPLYYGFIALLALVPIASYYRHVDAVWWSDAFYLSNYSNRGLVDGSWSMAAGRCARKSSSTCCCRYCCLASGSSMRCGCAPGGCGDYWLRCRSFGWQNGGW